MSRYPFPKLESGLPVLSVPNAAKRTEDISLSSPSQYYLVEGWTEKPTTEGDVVIARHVVIGHSVTSDHVISHNWSSRRVSSLFRQSALAILGVLTSPESPPSPFSNSLPFFPSAPILPPIHHLITSSPSRGPATPRRSRHLSILTRTLSPLPSPSHQLV
ncbi:hypothetical protein P152DRAFT_12627 [Eremomyces bilateralis CBS 781.70]|uniref:Uncharacterized protein n=1 Tax=Eremomyces bilateralis CBS 781.70 TaxID=1392243 RepID=A0A6G1GHA1_9PEZI|nr:uncharacterized protein P152DRAFT_12627 [Eremomyces bilateralis CBS 781.70]KAF1817249.1 hypothetical protein P152DRAFT_12627 [Eremomyces bilateralis CBS 781.70]